MTNQKDDLKTLRQLLDAKLNTLTGEAHTDFEYLSNVLIQWYDQNNFPQPLYLGNESSGALKNLPVDVVELVKDRITDLTLPRHLDEHDVPDWLKLLNQLERLSFPYYKGEKLDVRHLSPSQPYELEVREVKIREVNASSLARIYTPDAPENVEVVANYFKPYPADEKIYQETTMGYKRVVVPEGKSEYIAVNNNNIVKFDNGEYIVCRHIAIAELMHEQAYSAKQRETASGSASRPPQTTRETRKLQTFLNPGQVKKMLVKSPISFLRIFLHQLLIIILSA
ncbi:MAG: hypothetical protein V4568_12780 [Pseudomonadota bacterium]